MCPPRARQCTKSRRTASRTVVSTTPHGAVAHPPAGNEQHSESSRAQEPMAQLAKTFATSADRGPSESRGEGLRAKRIPQGMTCRARAKHIRGLGEPVNWRAFDLAMQRALALVVKHLERSVVEIEMPQGPDILGLIAANLSALSLLGRAGLASFTGTAALRPGAPLANQAVRLHVTPDRGIGSQVVGYSGSARP